MTSAGAFVAAASGLNSSLCSALLPGLPIGVDSEGTSPKFPRANLHLHHWFPGNSMEDSTKSVHLRERVLTDDREGVFFFFFNKLIYLFLAALGLRCCPRAFSSCGEWGLLFVVVRGLLTAVASLVAEHGL